ncbi:hypothetical protein M0R45_032070 [Rubus argutus]|uniref:Uncharacterized protein n=1 Tax=Rubus argutus TaxID=59490 RepID=A0AAW1WGK0_RUBAR
MGTSKWEQKRELCRKSGWTEEDFSLAFRKNLMFMTLSDRNFSSKIDFLVNKMGLQPADMAANPTTLTYSSETWIIPRCAVITLLQLKGFITKGEFSVSTMLLGSKTYFLKRFVIQYQEQVPELLSIFQGKMGLWELGIGFAERSGME